VTRNIVFHRAGLESVSPMVSVWWRKSVIDLLNQLPELAINFGGMAEEACADFIVAFAALPPQKGISLRTEVFNLGLRWERVHQAVTAEIETRERAHQWHRWLLEEIDLFTRTFFANDADRRTFPVLIDMDPPYHVTQGGTVLFQRLDHRDYREGEPLWVTPARASRLAKARVAALERRPKPTGMSVDEYEALLRDRLEAAGFDFRHPDRKLACRVVLACGWEPVACEQTFLYYEARDDGIEFGRWFQHGPEAGSARHERVALRFSSPKLRGYEFRSTMGMCAGPEDARTFARMLTEVFSSGPDRRVSKWRAELRRYEPT
jgi:hypothetical protein